MKIQPEDLGYEIFFAESGRYEYVKFLPAYDNFFFGLEIIQDGNQNFGWLVLALSNDPGKFDESEKVFLCEAPRELVSVCEIDDFLMKEARSGKHYLQ